MSPTQHRTRLPDPLPNVELPDDPLKAPTSSRVGTFGDSLMLGQWVPEERKFSHVPMKALAAQHGLSGRRPFGKPRSGAHIGDGIASSKETFIYAFPSFFASDPAKQAFLRGDERVGNQRFGDIPSTYPTVMGRPHLFLMNSGQPST